MPQKAKPSPIKLSIKPKAETKKLLKPLQDRARTVLSERYGLETGVKKTLESVGQMYHVTRERARQIENFALQAIRKSDSFAEARALFDELKEVIGSLGGVVAESDFLEMVYPNDVVSQNNLHFYLVLGDDFTRFKGDDKFHDRWTIDPELTEHVQAIISTIHDQLVRDQLLEEAEIVERFLSNERVNKIPQEYRTPEMASQWLTMSRALGRNQMGLWGLADSPSIRTRGVRDYAYLILRQQGSPLHFREVAQEIADKFGRPVHVATVHNELIKDSRFVLIGRGLYALREWGYESGPARDVIKRILEKEGPLTRDQIIEKVKRERYLKDNTILVNLQNSKYFKKDAEGRYYIVS